ncbi:hypothetical protein FOMPIDRAFT_1056775 [Fomitopsis schrenkii]|uniref:Uncharacterized protein n=1 Tax=Fomitopsis schrenkii TaxID=2126942 RepID=S8F0H8_FOMSC|nr:hypothetical protein FOMPIDRAFT_1056775 [Fomitopsis schrenkii]
MAPRPTTLTPRQMTPCDRTALDRWKERAPTPPLLISRSRRERISPYGAVARAFIAPQCRRRANTPDDASVKANTPIDAAATANTPGDAASWAAECSKRRQATCKGLRDVDKIIDAVALGIAQADGVHSLTRNPSPA